MKSMAVLMLVAGIGATVAGAEVRYSAGPTIGTTLWGVTEQSETVWGGQVGAHFPRGFSLELAVLRLTDHPTEERLGIEVNAALDMTPIQLSARVARPVAGKRLLAYVLGGIGYCVNEDAGFEIRGLTPDGPVAQTGELRVNRKDALGYHVAAGFEWFLVRDLTLLLEYRYAVMDTDATISGLSANSPEGEMAIAAFEKDFWDNNEMGLLRAGLNWRF